MIAYPENSIGSIARREYVRSSRNSVGVAYRAPAGTARRGSGGVEELLHASALSMADHHPGDQVIVKSVPGVELPGERYLVTDVVWGKRQSYRYGVPRLIKAGKPYERGGGTCLTP